MKPSEGIQLTVRAVLENAYVRAMGLAQGKSFHEVSPPERGAIVERFDEFIVVDQDILTAAMEQYRLEAGGYAELAEPEQELRPFALDTEDEG